MLRLGRSSVTSSTCPLPSRSASARCWLTSTAARTCPSFLPPACSTGPPRFPGGAAARCACRRTQAAAALGELGAVEIQARLVLDVRQRDRHGLRRVTDRAALRDVGVALELGEPFASLYRENR